MCGLAHFPSETEMTQHRFLPVAHAQKKFETSFAFPLSILQITLQGKVSRRKKGLFF
jgi:hypothetical protein